MFERITSIVLVFLLWSGVSQAQNIDFGDAQLIQPIEEPKGVGSVTLFHPQGVELLGRNKGVVVTERGSVVVLTLSNELGQWRVDDILQLPECSKQKRRIVKSSDERCLFVSGDGGSQDYYESSILSLAWEDEKLRFKSRQYFNGVVHLAVSPDGSLIAACSPKTGTLRLYKIRECLLEKQNEFVASAGQYRFLEECHSLAFSDDGRHFCMVGGRSHHVTCLSVSEYEGRMLKQNLAHYDHNGLSIETMGLSFMQDTLYIALRNGTVVAYDRSPAIVSSELGSNYMDSGSLWRGHMVYPASACPEKNDLSLKWQPFSQQGLVTSVNNTLLIADSAGVHIMNVMNDSLEFSKTIVEFAKEDIWHDAQLVAVSSPQWLMLIDSAKHLLRVFPITESSAESLHSLNSYLSLLLLCGIYFYRQFELF